MSFGHLKVSLNTIFYGWTWCVYARLGVPISCTWLYKVRYALYQNYVVSFNFRNRAKDKIDLTHRRVKPRARLEKPFPAKKTFDFLHNPSPKPSISFHFLLQSIVVSLIFLSFSSLLWSITRPFFSIFYL